MAKIATTVSSISKTHSNHLSSTSQDIGLAQRGSCNKRSSLTLFIPKNIDIDRVLKDNPPTFSYQRDCFVYILHIITSIPSGNWNLIDEEGYTNVNKQILQRRIHEYKSYLKYLVSVGLIEESSFYIPTVKSRGIRICSYYQSELVPIEITKPTLIKSITKSHSKINVKKTEDAKFLRKWFNPKVEVDLEGAQAFLMTLKSQEEAEGNIHAQQAYNSRILPLMQLAKGEYSFAVDNTGFRLHTNLTRTMKDLRKFIKYDGQNLHSIDIVNSQPFLARPLLNEGYYQRNNISDKIVNPRLTSQHNFPIMLVENITKVKNQSDVKNYINVVTQGKFYEQFAEILIENSLFEGDIEDSLIRKKVKEITFASLYSPNTAIGHNPEVKIFADVFPGVYSIIKIIKTGHGEHSAYSILLQRLEAELILDKICKRINKAYPNIPIFTIHDSIITTEEYIPVVTNFMRKIMKINIGASPVLKIEEWV